MKLSILLTLALLATACGKDKVTIYHDQTRIEQLEARVLLLEQVSVLQEQKLVELQDLLALEEAARISGDQALSNQLSSAVAAQTIANLVLQFQINNLRSRINNLDQDLSALQDEVTNLSLYLDLIQSDLQDQIDALASNTPVEVIKPCANAKEVLLKINGKLYGTMNHISTNGNSNNVNGVKIALEELTNGTYVTTSNSGNCTFQVSNGEVL